MNRLHKLIAVAVLINVGFILANLAVSYIPGVIGLIASLGLVYAFFYFYFSYITKVIYKFAGVEDVQSKPTHSQAQVINKYWYSWIIVSVLVNAIPIFFYTGIARMASIIINSVGLLLVVTAYFVSRRRFMGHSKKSLFQ